MRAVLSLAVAFSALALPVVARATTMDNFTLTGAGIDVTFALPSHPVPVLWDSGVYFGVGAMTVKEYDEPVAVTSAFFEADAAYGGFAFYDEYFDVLDSLDFTGPQLFSGTTGDPTFALGTYKLTPVACEGWGPSGPLPGAPCTDTLTITSASAATPEPESLALLGTGALGVFALLHRRMSGS